MKAYYDSKYKLITYSVDSDELEGYEGNITLSEEQWLNLLKETGDIYLDSDTPEDLSRITYKEPVIEAPVEIQKAIEQGAKEEQLRQSLEYLARYQALQLAPSLGNEELLTLAPLYPDWEENMPYTAGDPVNHNGILFKVKQAHTSQLDWLPENTPALYTKVTPEGTILEFGKNPDGTDRDLTNNPYTIGERCMWEGKLYESIFEGNNIWSPADYPAGWKEV